MTPKGWTDDDWYDFEEYLQSLPPQDLKNELQWLETIGNAKQSGKNLVCIEQFYEM